MIAELRQAIATMDDEQLAAFLEMIAQLGQEQQQPQQQPQQPPMQHPTQTPGAVMRRQVMQQPQQPGMLSPMMGQY